jgi:hypothetical protein
MATQYADVQQQPVAGDSDNIQNRFLFGPVTDFLFLGGSSLIVLPFLFLLPTTDYREPVAAIMMIAANLINHPHFAHSYQLFYRGFAQKISRNFESPSLRIRYIVSGIAVPTLLVAFFAYCIAAGDAQLLGYAGNAMALFVGWHYVKQGYGMIMVDCALKRQFFDLKEKKILLINSYVVWMAAWLGFNHEVHTNDLWGLKYYTFDLPQPLVVVGYVLASVSTIAALSVLVLRWRKTRTLPVNGVIAYSVSLYVWLLFVWINPLWGLVIPALHSLQYLIVVWRFQINYERAQATHENYKAGTIAKKLFGQNYVGHLFVFALAALVFGFIGFWALPTLLNAYMPYDKAIFGGTLFLFSAWIFINVHHYFLDSVMWRRENPDTKNYLFS